MTEELPSDWNKERLGKLCLKTNQKDPRDNADASFIYVDVSSISNQSFSIIGAKSLMGRDAPSRARKLIFRDDVIFATVRPTLKRVALVTEEFDDQICSTGFCVLRAEKEHLDPVFLYFYLLTEKITNIVEGLQKGATYPAISDSDLFSQIISLPPLPEQRAISHVLRTVQQAREARLRELELERERKAALMEHLFTHGTRGEPTKQTEIGEIPESWNIVKLGEALTSTQYGLSVCGNLEGRYPILRMNCLVDGYACQSDLQYVDLERSEFEKFRLNKGDILFNRTNSSDLVGKTGLFNLGGDFVFASYLIRLSVNKNMSSSEYLNYYINMNSIQKRLKTLASRGVSQSNINATKLRGFLIPRPHLSEQIIIADILKACDICIFGLEKEACLLEELFRAMLEELMTGRLPSRKVIEMHPG